MNKLAEKIFIELIKIAETDIKFMKSIRDCAEKDKVSFNYYVASLAWAYVIEFQKVKEELEAEKN